MILTRRNDRRWAAALAAMACGSLLWALPVCAQSASGPLGKPDIKRVAQPPSSGAHPRPRAAAPAGGAQSDGLGLAGPEQSVFGPPPVLTGKGKAATTISGQWQSAGNPMRGLDGSVVYAFGDGEPEVVCTPLNICDIQLEAGEEILPGGLDIGDSARWLVQPIPGRGAIPPHIIVKPTDVGLETDIIVSTDRRTYHIKLISDQSRYVPLTEFVYPMEMLAQYQAKKAEAKKVTQHMDITEYPAGPILTADRLDFNYKIKGDAYFRPVRVYNDGVHTIIQLPPEVQHRRAPVLMIVNLDAPSSAGPTAAVNYRLVDNRFIVDSIFRQAVLVSGVGGRAKTVTITLKRPDDGEG